MMTTEISATEAARRLGDLLARVRYRGETFLIRRGRMIVARLGPLAPSGISGRELRERWERRSRLTPAEARALASEVRAARKRLNRPPGDPWER
jgi:antitoxin (DNA-binding transcriptional repressor) of toxin-antitoxin stability system